MVLPFEVYGLIIDSLAEDDKELTTVRACSSVCGAFLPLTRKHIFASVTINGGGCSSLSIKTFMTHIERNPKIGEYVRELQYPVDDDHSITLAQMRYILGKLTNLKSLLIWNHSGYDHERRNQEIDFPALDEVVSPAYLPRKVVSLHEYTTRNRCASATKNLVEAQHPDGLPLIDFTQLATIATEYETKEEVDVFQTLFIRANHLRNIDLSISEALTYADIRLAQIVMGSIQTLKTLEITSFIYSTSADLFSSLCEELEIISERNIIETLTIFVGIRLNPDADTNLRNSSHESGLLNNMLTKKDSWVGLKEVSVEFHIYSSSYESQDLVEVLEQLQETQFKGLSASETINFKFKAEDGPCC